VEQELLTLPEHLSSPPVCSRVRVARSLVFCLSFCHFLLTIELSLLLFTNFDYPFGIFKLFLLEWVYGRIVLLSCPGTIALSQHEAILCVINLSVSCISDSPKQTADGPFTVAVNPSEETGSFSITQSNPGEERVMIL
jgi:hypothetical protein